jgi:hypothetical protein
MEPTWWIWALATGIPFLLGLYIGLTFSWGAGEEESQKVKSYRKTVGREG